MTPNYLDHEGLIKARALSWAMTTGTQADELISVGRSTFAKCAAKWDPVQGAFGNTGSFTSYLTVSLNRAFGDYTKRYPIVCDAAEKLDVTLPYLTPPLAHPYTALYFEQVQSPWLTHIRPISPLPTLSLTRTEQVRSPWLTHITPRSLHPYHYYALAHPCHTTLPVCPGSPIYRPVHFTHTTPMPWLTHATQRCPFVLAHPTFAW